ncbi:hypothetical protein NLM59_09920 [Weeksellaceae bacterium KMM 9724]|uniref:hypothetical protein n=1 Tax=Profundicola chukchiensis TaxID=2961959 RepID=UPI00243870D6|nr:hypothetical protein [Profundicola chukchiensis]MDG4951244.1 hypothetical protein [Profundicola chukchiensis]
MREEILNTIVQHQQQLVDNLHKALETYETTTDLDEESTIDLDDQSHQANAQELKLEMNQKLQMEQNDLKHIKSLRLRESSEVQNGAVIETEEAVYFIGFTFAPIKTDNKTIFGVSLEAPVFMNNEGKKKGDKLVLGDKEQKILNIY